MLYNYWTGENMWKIVRQDPNNTPPDLEERVERLERQYKSIRAEWEEMADKVFRWMRRGQAREKVDAVPPTPADATVDPVSAAIMRRRIRRPSFTNGGE